VLLAVLLAFAAAASFAAGSALQHRVAGASSAENESRVGFVQRLVQRRSWLVGLVLSAAAFALHAAALSQGDLALVQPVIVSGIVFAVLIRSGLAHRLPPRRTILWLVLTWAGLALFLAVHPAGADRPGNLTRAGIVVGAGVLLAVVSLLLARASSVERRRGILLGAAAGVLFGVVAGVVKLVLGELRTDAGGLLSYWPLWTLVVVGLSAVVVNQRAYQAARLSVTAPILNIGQVLVAMAFGVIVFDERLGSTPAVLVSELAGLVLVITGVVKLSSGGEEGSDAGEREQTPAGQASGRGSQAD
jgi:drug/metabolite transporter (DMT)-like permease